MSNRITAKKTQDKRIQKNEKRKNTPLKPFVKWAGGKSQLICELDKNLEAVGGAKLRKYCEPMAGGGALLFHILSKYNFEEIYLSDINTELINAYLVIKNNHEELIAKLKEMQSCFLAMDGNGRKSYYYSVRDEFNQTQLNETSTADKAACFIFLNKTCFNGIYRVNKKGQFNVPMGAYKTPLICDEENLRNVNKALQRVNIICGDFTLSKSFIDKDTLVYIDPPYRPISETSTFTSYNSDVFDDREQLRLAKFIDEINTTGAKIILSNSDPKNVNPEDAFFDELYRRYNIKRVSASRMINSKAEKRGKINELIISN